MRYFELIPEISRNHRRSLRLLDDLLPFEVYGGKESKTRLTVSSGKPRSMGFLMHLRRFIMCTNFSSDTPDIQRRMLRGAIARCGSIV